MLERRRWIALLFHDAGAKFCELSMSDVPPSDMKREASTRSFTTGGNFDEFRDRSDRLTLNRGEQSMDLSLLVEGVALILGGSLSSSSSESKPSHASTFLLLRLNFSCICISCFSETEFLYFKNFETCPCHFLISISSRSTSGSIRSSARRSSFLRAFSQARSKVCACESPRNCSMTSSRFVTGGVSP